MKIYFPNDILLDDEVFINASNQLKQLSKDLKNLEKDLERGLENLHRGFQTPAGDKFIKSCESHLLSTLRDQSLVIDHISQNLSTARNKYETVFNEYQQLNNSIQNK